MDYDFRPIETDAGSLRMICDLLHAAFPGKMKFTYPYLKWQYTMHPDGKVFGQNAFFNEQLVAHYATVPIRLSFEGSVHRGLLSLNTATHPEHQGNRLFTRLAAKTYILASERGYEFVIGVANGNSTHGFLKNLGFSLIAPLDVRVGTGPVGIRSDTTVRAVYYPELIQWRLNSPAGTYFQRKECYFAQRFLLAKDVFGVVNDAPENLRSRPGFRPLNLYVGLGGDFKKGLYTSLPRFIKHSPFNLIYRDLTGGNLPVPSKNEVCFQLMDFDVD